MTDAKNLTLGSIANEDDNSASYMKPMVLNVSVAGIYTLKIENYDDSPQIGIVMGTFQNCKKHDKLIDKTEMERINERAETAINNLFHNIIELEQSEHRLNRRKARKPQSHSGEADAQPASTGERG